MDTINYKGHTINIMNDEDPESPRDWDNLGIMACKHRNYNLGDVEIPESYFSDKLGDILYLDSKESVTDWITETYGKIAVILPLYLLDHSGISISTDRYSCDPQGWDTSMVGFIFITEDKIKKEYNVKRISKQLKEKVINCLINEVQTYDDYLTGNVYGYDTDTGDSCWGFFGDEGLKDAEEQGKAAIDYYLEQEARKKEKKTKAYIKNRVPYEYRTL